MKPVLIIGSIAVVVGVVSLLAMKQPATSAAISGGDAALSGDGKAQSQDGKSAARASASNAKREATAINALKAQDRERALEAQRRGGLQALAEASSDRPGELSGMQGAAGGGAVVPYTRYPSNTEGIGHAITESMPAIRDCYDRFWGHGETPPSNVRVHIAVEPDPVDASKGKVAVAETVAGALQNGQVEGCLKNKLSQLSFERPKETVHANLPLVFADATAAAQPR